MYKGYFNEIKDLEIITKGLQCNREDFIFFDTETTGLDEDAEIVEITVLNADKEILFDSYVKPYKGIEKAASRINGITAADYRYAPTFADIADELRAIFYDKMLCAYNAKYDWRLLGQSYNAAHRSNVPVYELFKPKRLNCVMIAMMTHLQREKYIKLIDSCGHFNIKVPSNIHRSKVDTELTIEVAEALKNEHKIQAELF